MSYPSIDTYKIVKNLRTAGMDESVAAVLSDTFRESRELDLQNLSTKLDLKQESLLIRSDLRKEIAETKAELKQEIAETRAELKQEIAETRAELKQEISILDNRVTKLEATMKEGFAISETNNAKTKVEIIRWNLAMMVALMGFVFASLKYFVK